MKAFAVSVTFFFIAAACSAQQSPGVPMQPGHFGPGGMRGPGMRGPNADMMTERIARQLGLSDTQKAGVEKIIQEVNNFKRTTMMALHNTGALYLAQFAAEKMNPDTLENAEKATMELRANTVKFMQKKLVEFHDLLTPEQRATAVKQTPWFIQQHFLTGME